MSLVHNDEFQQAYAQRSLVFKYIQLRISDAEKFRGLRLLTERINSESMVRNLSMQVNDALESEQNAAEY
jgi:hypothetical protein